ncbi:MAG TPA: hypothetical protein VFK57_04140 [Vicinamibacterales bacterium]|nr:hypothetical protein [Vicinamibacterales bacterium]
MLLVFALGALLAQQPETLSLLGEPLYAPKLAKAERAAADAELARAHAAYTAKPGGAAEVLALSRAHLALGRVGDALVILTQGIEANPEAAELFLERGRGYIVIRKFDVAARDLTKATKLPEARCSLALAQYLAADFDRSRATYKDCAAPGVFAYLAERRAGGKPAQRPVPEGPAVAPSTRIRFPGTVAKQKVNAAEPLSAKYLAAIEALLDGKEDAAREDLKQIVEKNRGLWMQPVYVAAEADYARLAAKKKK